jgi:hypothetical protein
VSRSSLSVHTNTILAPPAIRRSNIQRSTKHLIYCLIKQTAETPPALVELLCTTPSHGCYHVVCSRYDRHRGERKALSCHHYTHIYSCQYIQNRKIFEKVISATSNNGVAFVSNETELLKRRLLILILIYVLQSGN